MMALRANFSHKFHIGMVVCCHQQLQHEFLWHSFRKIFGHKFDNCKVFYFHELMQHALSVWTFEQWLHMSHLNYICICTLVQGLLEPSLISQKLRIIIATYSKIRTETFWL